MSASQEEIPPPPPPPPSSQTAAQQTPYTVSTIKLPILKKGEYDIWAMKMEHYLAHTDYLIWEVIQMGMVLYQSLQIHQDKLRFGGNDESKKMQKYILKQQFEGFSISNTEGLHKGYDRFQSLLRVDSLSFDDLYNNLRVFESDIKGSTASSSSSPQNVAFVSENTNSTNEVSTAYCVPNLSGQNTKYEQTSSYSLLANQSSCPQLDHEDLEQIDEYDLEEMDLKWQVAMISMRMKKFYKKTGRKLQFDAKEPVGFDKTKVECYNCHKTGHFARECRIKGTQDNRRREAWNSGNKDGNRTGQKEDSKALVTIDGEGVDWTTHSEDEDYALMACNSSDSDTEVISCSTKCKESYANLKKLYDAQREQLVMQALAKKDLLKGKESDFDNPPLNDKSVKTGEMHAVAPPMTGNYMPSGPEIEVDYSQFTYGPKQTQSSESESQSSENDTYCDFHEKRMARKAELNNGWNNVQRVNKQNQFVPSVVLTRTGKIPVSTTRASGTKHFSTVRQSFNRQAVPTSTAMEVNTDKPTVNRVRPVNVFHKTYSPSSRPFKKTTVLRTNFTNQKFNTAKVNAVSTVGGKRETVVKPSAGCNCRPQVTITGIISPNTMVDQFRIVTFSKDS
ncbi:ribonuclease H-like domain-containing protein [Tanacetum coccineum]|uniref:Ribonuclease H-like domain-containing protein n=1 Tax=Tanacetum coccineum TaxID=301880 RepID=A0ABQ5ELW4_9ASTR